MHTIQSENRNEVKEIKFHHKVKRFYHKNLFRKIYTVAIIGLIGANVFSMVKYASFADEAMLDAPTQSQDDVVLTMGPVDGHIAADASAPITGSEASTEEDIDDEVVEHSVADISDEELELSAPSMDGNKKVSSRDAGIYYENGYIEISNGEHSVYIKDRNQGATKVSNMSHDYEDADYIASLGTYYYRGNNKGATWEDLGIDWHKCGTYEQTYCMDTNIQSMISKGFDGGKIGEDDTGWEKGNTNNPCDESKGEYLPTVSDWEDALEIWGEVYGEYQNNDIWAGNYYFTDDILAPDVGNLFAVNDGYDGIVGFYQLNGHYANLWASMDEGYLGYVGYYLNSFDPDHTYTSYGDDYNNIAMPVRCFIYPEYIESGESHTVTFMDGNEEFTTLKVKDGETIKSEPTPDEEGFGFVGWYTDKNLTQEFNFNTTITSDITLYAKWADAGITYEDGYIKLTDGVNTMYIRDKNVGATVLGRLPEMMEKYNLINNKSNELYNQYGRNTDEANVYLLEYAEEIGLGSFDSAGDMRNYISQYYDYNYPNGGYESRGADVNSFGNFYYRGNNSGVNYNELKFDENDGSIITNIDDFGGFNEGTKLGEDDTGWEEGGLNNPCNEDEGEYLPSPDDWKNLMKIYRNIKGYELQFNNWIGRDYHPGDYGIYYHFNNDYLEFQNDMLIPWVGNIEGNSLNGFGNYSTWASLNNYGEVGTYSVKNDNYHHGLQYYIHVNPFFVANPNWGDAYYDYDNQNYFPFINSAAPVRCFLDPDYVEGVVKYTVTFMDGDDVLSTSQVKDGKALKEKDIPTPTKEGLGLVGWYTDPELKNEFSMGTLITKDITLYAKWVEKGVFHKNGYIKVTNGKDTMYVKDRNAGGVSDAAVKYLKLNLIDLELNNQCNNQCSDSEDDECYNECYDSGFLEKVKEELGTSYENVDDAYNSLALEVLEGILPKKEVEAFALNMRANLIFAQCDLEEDETCGHDEMIEYVNTVFVLDSELQEWDDLMSWLNEYFGEDDLAEFSEKYGNGYYWNLIYAQAYGNYYYRGNNSGVNYNDIKFEDPNDNLRITNTGDLIKKGFDGGKIGVEGQGWIEGNPNPCDPEKGEYLPSRENWLELMQLWGDVNGYEMEDYSCTMDDGCDYEEYGSGFGTDLFMNDMLIPYGGYIYYSSDGNNYGTNYPYLWTASTGGYVGYLDYSWLYYMTPENMRDYYWGEGGNYGNKVAMPVRCFLNIEEPEDEDDTPTTPVIPEPTTPSTPVNNYSGGGRKKAESVINMHNSADEKDSTQNDAKGSENTKTPTNSSSNASEGQTQNLDMKQYNATYTPEQNTAYQFAKSHGITTTSSIREAKMNTPLTRIQMAKMLSQYAMNVLGKTPDHSAGIINFKDVTNKLNTEYDNGVTLAYQLGIMGINMPNNEFRPYDKVTRAEFATALSRMLYDMEDGKGRIKYYEPHMARLYNEGIINNTNPKMEELRGYVMTMLMRTVE